MDLYRVAVASWLGLGLDAPWPMVGREADLERLTAAVRDGRHVVVRGGAGVGKTRLVAECALASSHPVVALTATAAAATAPFGALAPLVPPGVAAHGVAAAMTAAVEAVGAGAYLSVDDAHLLDPASAAVVHQLANGGFPIVCTIRTNMTTSDAITALWRSDGGSLIDLGTLPAADTARLLERVLGGPVDTGTVHDLGRRSGGNPLFLRELVRAALDANVLIRRRGLWTLVGPLAFGDRLADLLPLRVEALRPSVRRLVELVALAEPLPLDVLTPLVAPPAIESAERQGIVTVAVEAKAFSVRLSHPLYGDAIRAVLPASRLLRLYGELADALASASADMPRLRRGVFEVEAGRRIDPERLLDLCALARPFDPNVALMFARAAVDAGGGVPAALVLADLLAYDQRPDEVEAVLRSIDQAGLPPMQRVAVAATRALSLSFAPHRPEDALAVLDDVDDLGPVPMLRAARAAALMRAGRPADAIGLARPMAVDETLPAAVRLHASFSALA